MLTPPHALPSFFFCKYCCSCPSPRPQASLLSTLNTLIYVQPKVIALRAHIVLRGAAFNDRVRAVLIRSFDQSSFFSPNLKINVFWLKYSLQVTIKTNLLAELAFDWSTRFVRYNFTQISSFDDNRRARNVECCTRWRPSIEGNTPCDHRLSRRSVAKRQKNNPRLELRSWKEVIINLRH